MERARQGSTKSAANVGSEGPVATREDFRSAVWWSPALRTGPDGTVRAGPVRMADSLTRWRVTATALDATTRVGQATTTLRTRKPLVVRFSPPRFLRVDDTVRVPLTLHSLLETPASARWLVEAAGLEVAGPLQGVDALPPGALRTHDLVGRARTPGTARLRAEARTEEASDALAMSVPIHPQGVPTVLASSATTEGDLVALPPLRLPATAEPGSARLRILVSASVSQAVAAALPYLLEYPYGCTEQTMSRLLPAVVARAARARFAVPATGRLAEADAMLERGLARLAALRHEDGGFGWWERDPSDPWMTAYVLHGLAQAAAGPAATTVDPALLEGASRWLLAWWSQTPRRSGPPDPEVEALRAFALMALAEAGRLPPDTLPPLRREEASPLVHAFLLRATLASAQRRGDVAARVAALAATAIREGAEVHWVEATAPTRWTEDPVETTAWVLGALVAAAPTHPDVSGGVRWLLGARRGGDHWRSTRDTAAAVACLTAHAVASGDLGIGRRITLELNGLPLRPLVVTEEDAWKSVEVTLGPEQLPQGEILLRVGTERGLATATAALSFVDTGPAIAPASAGFEVTRTWWLLEPGEVEGRAGLLRRAVTEAVPSGALLDVDVTVRTDRPREHVLVTSPHVAGFEPERDLGGTYLKEAPSSPVTADHVDRRDDRTAFFVTRLEAGTHVFRHRVRAVHVGSFTALPASAELLYFPEVAGHGAGEAFAVEAAGPAGHPAGGR